MVTDSSRLASVVEEAMCQPAVALDLESNGFYRYPEHVCLVQLADVSGRVYLIDPLAVGDVSALGALLADTSVEKVLHSADYDLRSLDREWGFRILNLLDTSVAAAFTGMTRLGLGVVVETVLGVTLPKSKKLQRADWSRRPLSPEALRYAAEDVRHLLKLRAVLGERLDGLGRGKWVAEECARLSEVRHVPSDPRTAFLSVRGSAALDQRGLALLRALHLFREREALRLDRPHFKVMPDAALVSLARAPNADLAAVKGLGKYAHPPAVRGLRQAMKEGLSMPPLKRPARVRVNRPRLTRAASDEAARRLSRLKGWRMELGKRVGLDPALLWPRASLERLAREPESVEAEMAAPEVRRWQRHELAGALRRLLQSS